MPVYGWDASNFDWDRGPMNYAAAARDGIGFATHKATEGTRTVHNRYGEAMRRARDAGIPVLGAYHVVRTPGNAGNGTIAEQVRHFLTYLDQQTPWWRTHPAFMLQVDLEHWTYDKVAPSYGVEMCRQLRAQTGKWVVLYAPRWAYGDTIGGDTPLWASNYVNGAGHFKALYPGDGSSRWAPYSGRTPVFLQYTSSATIGGQGTCDANAYRGSLTQLAALVGGKTMTLTAQTMPAADTDTSDEEDDMPDQESFQLDPGFACDEAGNFLPGKKALILSRPVDPGAGYTTWVSATCEQGNVRLRVAVDPDGVAGWSVHLVSFDSNGGRAALATLVGLGGNVSIARCRTSATDLDDQTPVGVTFRTGKS